VSTTGFDEGTPWADAPAFDGTVQALSGLAYEQGGGIEPVYHTVPVTDMMTPLLSTFGVCAALYYRERTGKGQRVRTSLVRSALAAQAAACTAFEGMMHPRGGRDYPGASAGERWYRCGDGRAIWVEARTAEERAAFARALGVDELVDAVAQSASSATAEILASAFAQRPASAWLGDLRAAGVPAAPVVTRAELLTSEHVEANRLAVTQEHPVWGTITAPGVLVHASKTPSEAPSRAPLLSEHALEVLRELGYSVVEMREFAETGQVVIPELPDESQDEHRERVLRTAMAFEEELARIRHLHSQDVG
jgi:crotonobetainyl-CoA:carnitine CoA-transferase CaiB-like acyl-CoA transferase